MNSCLYPPIPTASFRSGAQRRTRNPQRHRACEPVLDSGFRLRRPRNDTVGLAKPMIPIDRLRANFPRAAARVEPHVDVLRKAVSFALIGVINASIDAGVFLLAYSYLNAAA